MSIEGQGHFFTIYFPGFVCFVLYLDKISGERLQDHWSSGIFEIGTFYLRLSFSSFTCLKRCNDTFVIMASTTYDCSKYNVWILL